MLGLLQRVAVGNISNVSEAHIASIFVMGARKNGLYLRPRFEKNRDGEAELLCRVWAHYVLEWGLAREAYWPLKGPVVQLFLVRCPCLFRRSTKPLLSHYIIFRNRKQYGVMVIN